MASPTPASVLWSQSRPEPEFFAGTGAKLKRLRLRAAAVELRDSVVAKLRHLLFRTLGALELTVAILDAPLQPISKVLTIFTQIERKKAHLETAKSLCFIFQNRIFFCIKKVPRSLCMTRSRVKIGPATQLCPASSNKYHHYVRNLQMKVLPVGT